MEDSQSRTTGLPRETKIALFAVALVAVVALAAVLVPHRGTDEERLRASTTASTAAVRVNGPVVTAPPLAAQAMGAPAACRNCGVVQNVVAVHDAGDSSIAGFLMNIQMDDGTTRTIEDRGALAAGSRVVVEGERARALAP